MFVCTCFQINDIQEPEPDQRCVWRDDCSFAQHFYNRVASTEIALKEANARATRFHDLVTRMGLENQDTRLALNAAFRREADISQQLEAERLEHRATQEALGYEKALLQEAQHRIENLQITKELVDNLMEAGRKNSLTDLVHDILDHSHRSMKIIMDHTEAFWKEKFVSLAERAQSLTEWERSLENNGSTFASPCKIPNPILTNSEDKWVHVKTEC